MPSLRSRRHAKRQEEKKAKMVAYLTMRKLTDDDPVWVWKAHQIGLSAARQMFPRTQTDGDSD